MVNHFDYELIGLTQEEINRITFAKEDETKDKVHEETSSYLSNLYTQTLQQLEALDNFRESSKKIEGVITPFDFHAPFENDVRVVGKWEVIAIVSSIDDFTPENFTEDDEKHEEIYLLSDGHPHNGFGWTKGYLTYTDDGAVLSIPYDVKEINAVNYMFIKDFFDLNMQDRVWVLRQTAHNKNEEEPTI